jgi:uncharacterized protein
MFEPGFEWDETKNAENIRKHGVSFRTACRIFAGPVWRMIDGREDYGELRETSIGRIGLATIIVVVHTDRNGVTRIISARAATTRERKRYDEAFTKGFS